MICRGRRLSTGDRVPIDYPLTLMIGDGRYADGFADIDSGEPDGFVEDFSGDIDEFEEVSTPQSHDIEESLEE